MTFFWKLIAGILNWLNGRKDATIQQQHDVIKNYEAEAEVTHQAAVIQQEAEDEIHEVQQQVADAPDEATAAAAVSNALNGDFMQSDKRLRH